MTTRLFYQGKKLCSLINGDTNCSLLRTASVAHAELRTTIEDAKSLLMATNEPGSVLQVRSGSGQVQSLSYTVYGSAPTLLLVLQALMFNSEWREPVTGCYHLGNGYRLFNPALMRFHSPDNLSPFGLGGLNTYAYCEGDPLNRSDPTGHKASTTPSTTFEKLPEFFRVQRRIVHRRRVAQFRNYRAQLTQTDTDIAEATARRQTHVTQSSQLLLSSPMRLLTAGPRAVLSPDDSARIDALSIAIREHQQAASLAQRRLDALHSQRNTLREAMNPLAREIHDEQNRLRTEL